MSEQGQRPETSFKIGELPTSIPGPRTIADFALTPDHPKVQDAVEMIRINNTSRGGAKC